MVQPYLTFTSIAQGGQFYEEQSVNQQRMDSLFHLMEEQDKHSVHIIFPYKDGVVYSCDQVLQVTGSAGVNQNAIQAFGQMEWN